MGWKTIKAVYGYVVDVSDCLDKDGYIKHDKLQDKFSKINFSYCPTKILNLKNMPQTGDELIQIFPYGMNGDGIAVGTREIQHGFTEKLVNTWKARDKIKDNYDYSIQEFEHYKDKDGYHHYDILHRFTCCSKSNNKYIVIGVTYDEVDRNLFLDSQFDHICEEVFNKPTIIENISDEFFQHDSREFKTNNNDCVYGKYHSEIRSLPKIRKDELLSPNESVKHFIKSLSTKLYPELGEPECYLMIDDCTSCT
jgi:hypothetical protein